MEDKVPIIIYNNYGLFEISDKAREYLKTKGEYINRNNINPKFEDLYDHEYRWNKVLIEYLQTFKGRESDPDLTIRYIPKEYYDNNFYEIDEYDGLETLYLNEKEYELFISKNKQENIINNIKETLYLDINDSEKISKLKKLI